MRNPGNMKSLAPRHGSALRRGVAEGPPELMQSPPLYEPPPELLQLPRKVLEQLRDAAARLPGLGREGPPEK